MNGCKVDDLKLTLIKHNVFLLQQKKIMHRNVDIRSVMPGTSIPVQISNSVLNIGFVFDNQLNLDEEIKNVKRREIVNLINFSRVAKFIDKDLKIKLVHWLVFTIIDFCNSMYYGLQNIILNCLQMLINGAARIVVGFPRFSRERINPVCLDLRVLTLEARIKYKICLLAYIRVYNVRNRCI